MKDAAVVIETEEKPVGVSFVLPDGLDLEDAKEGDVIERVVAIKIGADGKGQLESIEGIPLGGTDVADIDEEMEEEEFEPSDTDIVGNIKQSLGMPVV